MCVVPPGGWVVGIRIRIRIKMGLKQQLYRGRKSIGIVSIASKNQPPL